MGEKTTEVLAMGTHRGHGWVWGMLNCTYSKDLTRLKARFSQEFTLIKCQLSMSHINQPFFREHLHSRPSPRVWDTESYPVSLGR